MHFLNNEKIDTQYIPRKAANRTSAVILGIEPPDKFPLVYYRDNCADINLTIDDVLAAPVPNFARCSSSRYESEQRAEPQRDVFAAEVARANGADRAGWLPRSVT
ncbi:MAG: hypothetical protein U0528_04950 [Anaerolineae bacterium]